MIFSPRGPHPYPMMQAPPVIPKLYWGALSDEQRLMELWKCFDQLADRVNQLGYYYVPVFGGTWSATSEYAPLTVVEAPSGIPGVTTGDSYTALDYVPVGTPLTDERYWAKTGNYNAQVAELQAQVEGYDARIQQAQDVAAQAQTSAEQAQDAADQAQSTADGKAPKVHTSSSGSTYGQASASSFGHVKLTDSVSGSGASAGVAATPKLVQDALAGVTITRRAILIADSWGDLNWLGYSNGWLSQVKSYLLAHGYTEVRTSSVGGSGILAGDTFRKQLSDILADMGDSAKGEVDLVYIGGGWNDTHQPTGDFATAFASLDALVASEVPQARCIVDYFGSASGAVDSLASRRGQLQTTYSNAAAGAHGCSNITFKLSPCTLVSNSWFATDGYHPNETGSDYVAEHVISTINGVPSYCGYRKTLKLKASDWQSDNWLNFQPTVTFDNSGTQYVLGGYCQSTVTLDSPVTINAQNRKIFTFDISGEDAGSMFKFAWQCYLSLGLHFTDGKYRVVNGFLNFNANESGHQGLGYYVMAMNDAASGYLEGTVDRIISLA